MRADFTKVLTERPRSGGPSYKDIRKKKERKKIGEDDKGSKEGMRYPYGYNQKNFTDLIGPLYKFLRSRVGKRWDKVYSEICSQLKGRSTQQQHLLQHLNWAVTTDLAFENGKLVHANGIPFPKYNYRRGDNLFYVDPRDGILKAPTEKQIKRFIRKRKPPKIEEFKADGTTYRLVGGIWYRIITKTINYQLWVGVDPETKKNLYRPATKIEETKVQLNTATLRKFGITNEVHSI